MQTDIAGPLTDLWSQICGVEGADAFWTAATGAFARIGFDQTIYCRSPGLDSAGRRIVDMRTSTGLAAWADDYAAHDDAQSDPMFTYGVFLPGPVFTGADHLQHHPYLNRAEREVISRGGDHGFRSGVAVPMLFPRPGVIGGWNLLCTEGADETERLTRRLNGFLPAFATMVQARIENLEAAGPSPLSNRDSFILARAA